jgi:hypothetical protein
MDYFSVNNEGYFYNEILDTLPEWTSDDEGREIYVISDNRRYYGSSTGWVKYLVVGDALLLADFSINTIVTANTNNNPNDLTINVNEIVGRISGGVIDGLSAAQVRTIINVEDNADITDVTNVTAAGAVMKTDFDVNTILKADIDNIPEALVINENEILGRYDGEIDSLSAIEVRDILNLEDGADVTNTLSVSAVGAVMKTSFDANTILKADVDDTPVKLTIEEDRILSRYGSFPISGSTAEQIRDILNVEDGADVTDYDNVSLAGAVMKTDFDVNTILKADIDNIPESLTININEIIGRISGDVIDGLSAAQVRTIINVEDNADVTDAVNIASSVHGVAEKTVLADDDEFALTDSASSYVLKKIKASNFLNVGIYYDLEKVSKTDDYSVLTTDENVIIELKESSIVFGDIVYSTPGTYSWTCPSGVTSVSVVCVGGGAGGDCDGYGGGGGGLGWKNNITVVPENLYTVVVGSGGVGNCTSGGNSYFINTSTVCGYGGDGNAGGSYTGDGGGSGGYSGSYSAGGGGAGGYSGNGGFGDSDYSGGSGSGGGGGGGSGSGSDSLAAGGGGVGLFGEGESGACGLGKAVGGGGGSGGKNGSSPTSSGGAGGLYGGGGGGCGD